MTSLEHEHDDLSRGNDSVSDYDYDQLAEQVNWGDMEVNSSKSFNLNCFVTNNSILFYMASCSHTLKLLFSFT